jgi:hypothetical protein
LERFYGLGRRPTTLADALASKGPKADKGQTNSKIKDCPTQSFMLDNTMIETLENIEYLYKELPLYIAIVLIATVLFLRVCRRSVELHNKEWDDVHRRIQCIP